MRNIAPARAVDVLEKVLSYTSPKSSLGGQVCIHRLIALSSEIEAGCRRSLSPQFPKNRNNAKTARFQPEILHEHEALSSLNQNTQIIKIAPRGTGQT